MNKEQVYLALSGGVDSAVAAALLLDQGYEVRAFFLKIWSDDLEDAGYCPWVEDRRDALAVGAKLGIPVQTLDFEDEYKKEVFSYFVREYTDGRTPNPDILCNEVIKFGAFLEYALENGADYIATGHHVRRVPEVGKDSETSYELHKGVDEKKDQSYFLASLNQHQLRHSLFPIGKYTKEEVRRKASELGLDRVADKQSTRGICFIGDVDLKKFLEKYTIQEEGEIINTKGEVIGRHDGVAYYTIGQRKGLDIPAVQSDSRPYFVVGKKAETNQLIVTDEPSELNQDSLYCKELHWIDGKIRKLPLTCGVKIRYNQSAQDATLSFHGLHPQMHDVLSVQFEESQRAVAPGQIIAFYDNNNLLGSAVIA
jgi:tRNA-specific 2-thiouridylase